MKRVLFTISTMMTAVLLIVLWFMNSERQQARSFAEASEILERLDPPAGYGFTQTFEGGRGRCISPSCETRRVTRSWVAEPNVDVCADLLDIALTWSTSLTGPSRDCEVHGYIDGKEVNLYRASCESDKEVLSCLTAVIWL